MSLLVTKGFNSSEEAIYTTIIVFFGLFFFAMCLIIYSKSFYTRNMKRNETKYKYKNKNLNSNKFNCKEPKIVSKVLKILGKGLDVRTKVIRCLGSAVIIVCVFMLMFADTKKDTGTYIQNIKGEERVYRGDYDKRYHECRDKLEKYIENKVLHSSCSGNSIRFTEEITSENGDVNGYYEINLNKDDKNKEAILTAKFRYTKIDKDVDGFKADFKYKDTFMPEMIDMMTHTKNDRDKFEEEINRVLNLKEIMDEDFFIKNEKNTSGDYQYRIIIIPTFLDKVTYQDSLEIEIIYKEKEPENE